MVTIAEMRYEAARGEVAEQSATLDGLRARCGTLLTANSLTATFLGSRAITASRGVDHGWTLLGVGAFVLAYVLLGLALLPVWDWRFTIGPAEILKATAPGTSGAVNDQHLEALTQTSIKCHDHNEWRLATVMWLLIAAAMCVLAATVAWLWELS